MAPNITLVGGGSTHWTPTLVVDFANSKILSDVSLTLVDTSRESLPTMVAMIEHLAHVKGIKMTARAAEDLDDGLLGADYVLTTLSVGGFGSMIHDIEIPYRYGIRQPVGDSVGPGGIFRSLRSIPVILEIARHVQQIAPQALLVNVSNPLTSLCRAITKETEVEAVGLCNELVGMTFVLSLLFDLPFSDIDFAVGGVNHLPLITSLSLAGKDGFPMLLDLLQNPGPRGDEPIWMDPPKAMHALKRSHGDRWAKSDIIGSCAVKFDLFKRFGVLPGSSDTHVVEFFSGFLNEHSDFGRDWGVHHYGIAGHREDKRKDDALFQDLKVANEVPPWPSGEVVASLLEGMVSGDAVTLPVNLPNSGQVKSLPEGVVVECMGISDKDGVKPRDQVEVGGLLGHHLSRVVSSQEATIEAATTGTKTLLLEAMFLDPMTSSLAYEQVLSMSEEMLCAMAPWLPNF